MESVIETRGLRKVYPGARARGSTRRGPAEVVALEGLDLEIGRGEVFGLLGPNGAGKTTTLSILTTLALPSGGEARIAGADPVADAIGVRRRIGVVPQRPNPDRGLSAFENLLFHGAYFGMATSAAGERAGEMLARFDLGDKRDASPDTLSGGQLQRLMLARALVHDPEILFLDEPTVGLDPQVRLDLWEILGELRRSGRTIVLTTHYMEEADRLCDRVAILDEGRLLIVDTPANLRSRAPGGTLIELVLDGPTEALRTPAEALDGTLRAESDGETLRVFSRRGGESVADLIALADDHGRQVRDIHLMRPSLETLFIHLTGRKLT